MFYFSLYVGALGSLIQPCSHLALGWALSKEIKFLLR